MPPRLHVPTESYFPVAVLARVCATKGMSRPDQVPRADTQQLEEGFPANLRACCKVLDHMGKWMKAKLQDPAAGLGYTNHVAHGTGGLAPRRRTLGESFETE